MSTHQLLVFVLHVEAGGNAVPGVQESPALALLRQVVDEEPDQVDGQKDEDVGGQLLPAVDEGGGLDQREGHRRVEGAQHQRETGGHPAPAKKVEINKIYIYIYISYIYTYNIYIYIIHVIIYKTHVYYLHI